ncbi:MAG TPA: hypothetical protein VLY23_01875 [Candidatus Acidoferrum sp.]|nr:hypothetical protein [Candidatus Acidoferrum sp.]
MDNSIKQYADTLYERSLFESGRTLRDDRVKFAHEMAMRRTTTPLPLSGPEIQTLMNLFAKHVERCMEARFESYRTAYGEANRNPTGEEFREILASVEDVQRVQSQHSAHALGGFVGTHGGNRGMSFDLTPRSANGHDRVLGDLKVWRGRVQLARANGTDDEKFSRIALEQAKLSAVEDERIHPKVGVVVVLNGAILSTAHRGEFLGSHAEFIALEQKLPEVSVAGATVYTTLEPCTTRNHPKIPCADRLIERKVRRVVIGMLDPNPKISGQGQRRLRTANIITDLFPHDLMTEVEELNREFTRRHDHAGRVTGGIVDKWVSTGYEHKSGIAKILNEQGFDLGWVSADREAERIEFEGWEHVLADQPDGNKARLKIHDHPVVGGYLVLLKKCKT